MGGILRTVFVYVIVAPLLIGIGIIVVMSPLLAVGALWEARLGPEPYWQAFRRCFRIGWGNTIGRALRDL